MLKLVLLCVLVAEISALRQTKFYAVKTLTPTPSPPRASRQIYQNYIQPSIQPYQVYSQPQTYEYQQARPIAILRQDFQTSPEGSYVYAYETENGIAAEERAEVRPVGPGQALKTVEGGYSYTSPEGIPIQVRYVADENGFRAVGDHLPTPPPIPEAIQRSLAYIAAHPAQPERQYREYTHRYY